MKSSNWIKSRLRLWAIWSKLGHNPWHKHKHRKTARKKRNGVYIGTREAIPFMNEDAKRTLSHLLLRPGYMMRDYIVRGQHERYLAPLTALLVFYSVFTLIVAVVQPKQSTLDAGSDLVKGFQEVTVDTTGVSKKGNLLLTSVLTTMKEALLLTRLDLHPEAVNTPLKASIAAVEGDLRSKGVPLFLGSFIMLWLSMAPFLRKKGIGFSGAAAASAYILCQYCIFMFLALLLSLGQNTHLGILLMGALLFIDYRQMLGLGNRPALWLTVKTGLLYALIVTLFYILVSVGLVLFAYYRL